MSGQARLFRRGATYYHRAAIPLDIRGTYPKSEETFSLKTKNYDEALKLLRIAAVKVDEKFDAHRCMLRGENVAKPDNIFRDPSVVENKPRAALLSKIRDEWFKVKSVENSWTTRTKAQNQTWTNRFIAIVGDRPINQYTKADGRKFRDIMSSFPKNVDKFKELRRLTVRAIPKKAQSMGLELMSKANVNKYIIGVSALWKWISQNYDEGPSNPLDGMTYKIKTNPRKEREPFTVGELAALFKSPVYTGCESYKQWRQSGEYVLKNSYRYWIPLIGLFTGMRLGEIGQLYIEDIREEKGVEYFDIHEKRDDMSLKTPQSERQIPIHPELEKLRFMEHIIKMKTEGQERLFPDLKLSSTGDYSKNASMHFQRFLRAVEVKHGKNCFHSFRHSFEDACRNSGVPKEVMDALQGHKEKGMSARYGNGFGLATLNEAIQKVQYNGLDLSHLY